MARHKKSKEVLQEYGMNKSLQEIIEELGAYVQAIAGKEANFTIILPQKVMDHYQNQFFIPKKSPYTPAPVLSKVGEPPIKLIKEWTTAGVCYLYGDEKKEVADKKEA